ncbi:MAG: DNA polymerase III subunit delta, partial [Solirubrobacteraceae bacterium]
SRIENEVDKIKVHLKENETITLNEIEKYIGISKEYNVFELINAISFKEKAKSFTITKKLSENEKDHSIFQSLGLIYTLFSNLLILHGLKDRSNTNIIKELKINPYFVNNYKIAASNYTLKKTASIISYLRETDANKKGIDSGLVSDYNAYKELLFKIFN